MLSPAYKYGKIVFFPFTIAGKIIQVLIPGGEEKLIKKEEAEDEVLAQNNEEQTENNRRFFAKISEDGFEVSVNIICASEEETERRVSVKEIASTLSVFTLFGQNSFTFSRSKDLDRDILNAKARTSDVVNILSGSELA